LAPTLNAAQSFGFGGPLAELLGDYRQRVVDPPQPEQAYGAVELLDVIRSYLNWVMRGTTE
jgi:hypothetical protein